MEKSSKNPIKNRCEVQVNGNVETVGIEEPETPVQIKPGRTTSRRRAQVSRDRRHNVAMATKGPRVGSCRLTVASWSSEGGWIPWYFFHRPFL